MPFKVRDRGQRMQPGFRIDEKSVRLVRTAAAVFNMRPHEIMEAAIQTWAKKVNLRERIARFAYGEEDIPKTKGKDTLAAWDEQAAADIGVDTEVDDSDRYIGPSS